MATYKVIQDIEAEDKLVGPLSLRQFVYGGIAAVCAYLSFFCVTKGLAFFLVVLAPVALFTGFFAFPWGRDQPTEVWALGKIRFFLKPRRRIWDQSGVKDLVNITAPKKIIKNYTDGLSQTEVHSRLNALASTIDSRGWATKNVDTNLYSSPLQPSVPDSDRLIQASSLPQEVDPSDITAGDDMLDEVNNPVAHKLDEMVSASSTSHRQQIIQQLQQPSAPNQSSPATPVSAPTNQLPPPADYWFLNQPTNPPKTARGNAAFTNSQVVFPGSSDDSTAAVPAAEPTATEEAIAEELKEQREKSKQTANYQHMKVIRPLEEQTYQPQANQGSPATSTPVTAQPDPAKMVLANNLANNDDLNIATIQRIANKEDEQPDEVVISLHDHSS